MTIDECISGCEQVMFGAQMMKQTEVYEYNRQLAEWLKELKTHREIHEILLQTLVDFDLDMCCEDLMDDAEEAKNCEECCDNQCLNCWVRWAKMKAREVNADD